MHGNASELEQAAHEEILSQLAEMFPAWKRENLDAVLSSSRDNVEVS